MQSHSHRTDPAIEAEIERLREPVNPPSFPGGALRMRLETSPLLRRAVPTRLALAVGRIRGRRVWRRDPYLRERAVAAMEAIVAGTPRAQEARSLGRRHLVEQHAYRELYWQPWRRVRVEPDSAAHMRHALESGRGVIVSSCHTGPLFLHMSAFEGPEHVPVIVTAPWFFVEPRPSYWGRRTARWWQAIARRDERVVPTAGSTPLLAELLRRGELVTVYFDMPGSRSTRFLGKRVMLATGTARLAAETDAVVLPIRSRLRGTRAWADFPEPLDPRRFGRWEELHDALARVHERWLLDDPAAVEDPNRPGAWEGGAGPDAWVPGGGEAQEQGVHGGAHV
jgi:lauroyl/myristoyl acyltransferase